MLFPFFPLPFSAVFIPTLLVLRFYCHCTHIIILASSQPKSGEYNRNPTSSSSLIPTSLHTFITHTMTWPYNISLSFFGTKYFALRCYLVLSSPFVWTGCFWGTAGGVFNIFQLLKSRIEKAGQLSWAEWGRDACIYFKALLSICRLLIENNTIFVCGISKDAWMYVIYLPLFSSSLCQVSCRHIHPQKEVNVNVQRWALCVPKLVTCRGFGTFGTLIAKSSSSFEW